MIKIHRGVVTILTYVTLFYSAATEVSGIIRDDFTGQENGAGQIRGKRDTQQMSPPCPGTNKKFCTKVENYPTDKVASALKAEAGKYEQLFRDDMLPDQAPSITQRIDGPGEEELCMSQSRIIYPQAGRTKDNNWSMIVNQPNYYQAVRVEECLNAGSQCAMTENFPNTYTTECRQKFIYRQLVTVDEAGVMAMDEFEFPSCCVCILKSMY